MVLFFIDQVCRIAHSPDQKTSRAINKLGATLGFVCLILCGNANAATYNPVTAFSLAANPNGAWSYLYGTSLLPTPVTGCASTVGFNCWFDSLAAPNSAVVGENTTGSPLTISGTVIVPTNYLAMDPESQSDVDVRFTAPAAGSCVITGSFLGIDTSEQSHPVEIIDDGVAIFNSTISGYGQSEAFNLSESLKAGDVLDFDNLTGATWTNLSTGLAVTITPATTTAPEPNTYALVLTGLGLVAIGLRRRRTPTLK